MSQTEFVSTIDSRGSINIPKALQEAGYSTGIKVHVELKIFEGPADDLAKDQGETQ